MPVHGFMNDVKAFLSASGDVLRDNARRVECTAGRVSELVTSLGCANHELIVALQSFDRLKQEFEALGHALSECAALVGCAPSGGEPRGKRPGDLLAAITVGDLRERLRHRMEGRSGEQALNAGAAIDVDVVF